VTRRAGAVEAGVGALAKEPAKMWTAVEYLALTTYEGDLLRNGVEHGRKSHYHGPFLKHALPSFSIIAAGRRDVQSHENGVMAEHR